VSFGHESTTGSTLNRTKLVFANLPDGPVGWIVSGGHSEAVRFTEPYETVANLGSVYASQCASRTSHLDDLSVNGKRLFSILIGPFTKFFAPGGAILIEPDEELAHIPFSALIDHEGHYLNEQHDIVLAPPSATQIPSPNKDHRILDTDTALLVESRSADKDGQLEDPHSEQEISALASIFHNSIFLGSRIRVKEDFGRLLSRAALLHYAGHSATSVTGGALILSERGSNGRNLPVLLRSQDIRPAWFVPSKLAVLSACQTDRGQDGHWLDRDNLAVTLLNAGVPQVVASRWDVDSSATSDFMKIFYQKLIRGSTASEALRFAAESIRLKKRYEHPYYWAAFSVLESNSL